MHPTALSSIICCHVPFLILLIPLQVIIPVSMLRFDKLGKFGQTRDCDEDKVKRHAESPRNVPPTSVIKVLVWMDEFMPCSKA